MRQNVRYYTSVQQILVGNGTTLEATSDEKDLGSHSRPGLKIPLARLQSDEQYLKDAVISKGNVYLDESTLPKLFTSMVRPHLEYGNIIWSLRYQRDKLEIKKTDWGL